MGDTDVEIGLCGDTPCVVRDIFQMRRNAQGADPVVMMDRYPPKYDAAPGATPQQSRPRYDAASPFPQTIR